MPLWLGALGRHGEPKVGNALMEGRRASRESTEDKAPGALHTLRQVINILPNRGRSVGCVPASQKPVQHNPSHIARMGAPLENSSVGEEEGAITGVCPQDPGGEVREEGEIQRLYSKVECSGLPGEHERSTPIDTLKQKLAGREA